MTTREAVEASALLLLDKFNFLLDHAMCISPSTSSLATETVQLTALKQLHVLHLLPIIELIISSELPIPSVLRHANDRNRLLTLAKLLLGFIVDDLLPSIHHPNLDGILKGGAIAFALDQVDPRRLADGELDEEEAKSVVEAVWRVAESKGWEEHYETGNALALSRTETIPPHYSDHEGDTTTTTVQYHDSNMVSAERVLSPSMSSSVLESVTLPARSVSERTTTDDATVTGSYRGIGAGGHLGLPASSRDGSWRIRDSESEVYGFNHQRSRSRDDSDDSSHHRPDSEEENNLVGERPSNGSVDVQDSTVDIITSSFSHSSPAIPIRYDGFLNVVDLEEELRSFELDREAKQGASWSDHGREHSRLFSIPSSSHSQTDTSLLRKHNHGRTRSGSRRMSRMSGAKKTLSLLEERARLLERLAAHYLES